MNRLLSILLILFTGNSLNADLAFNVTGTIGAPISTDTEGLDGASWSLDFVSNGSHYSINQAYGFNSPSLTSTSPVFSISGSSNSSNNTALNLSANAVIFPSLSNTQQITDETNFPSFSVVLPSSNVLVLSFAPVTSVANPSVGDMATPSDFATNFFTDTVRVSGEFYGNTPASLAVSQIPEPSSTTAMSFLLAFSVAIFRRRKPLKNA